MEEDKTSLFDVICKNCMKVKRVSQTHVHIDWEKRIWTYICLDPECGMMETFDEGGKRILPKYKKEKKDEDGYDKKEPN